MSQNPCKTGGVERNHVLLLLRSNMAATQKRTYQLTNWKEYNNSLVSRGDITFWFSNAELEKCKHANEEPKVGRPFVYRDPAIEPADHR